jgi:HD-GYP domain-containing protein (c-di-GMP phosphodiesterase class II)
MLEEEVAERLNDYMYVKDMIILGMADLVESRDNSTGGHIKRTSEVMKIFTSKLVDYKEELGVNSYFLKCLTKAAPMHDIGKIAIDDKVLRKKGKYTEVEFNEMKKHTTEGARIVKQILENVEDVEFYNIIRNVAHYHHEKWNGKGYPQGLAGEDIPLEARIMALADVFDALVSKRCYKEAFSYDKAFMIIEESLGEHFDPNLGKIFLDCRPILEDLYDEYKNE